ncbi:hypothetical protein GGF46_004788 [Coemansia sp. RSA 552]|nr:hypothetical protein GGF46_004788 [Coemansia sp. RSA 552]
MLDSLLPQCAAPDWGPWLRRSLAALSLLSVYFAGKTVARFHGHLRRGHPAAEAPSMFLLPWLASYDVLAAISTVLLLWPDDSTGVKAKIVSQHLLIIQRILAGSQACSFLLLLLLSVHNLSVSGLLSRKLDMVACAYYGMAASIVAFAISHPLLAGSPAHRFAFQTVLPLCTLAVLVATAWRLSKAQATMPRVLAMYDDSVTIRVSVNPRDFARFAYYAMGLAILFHLPWFVWAHTQRQTVALAQLVAAAICARGALSFALCCLSPAENMHLQDRGAEHVHQE